MKTSGLSKILIASVLTLLTACGPSSFAPTATDMSSVTSDRVSAANSSIQVSSPNVADGVTPADVTLQLRDKDNAPIAGLTMKLSVSGSQNTLVPCTSSDLNGLSRCKVFSTFPETKTITCAGSISLSVNSTFNLWRPNRSAMGIVTSGSAQNLPSGVRIISSSGIVESFTVLRDTQDVMRAQTSVQGPILGQ